MSDLETFRQETRVWLQENCPSSLFGRETTPFDGCWGGRKYKYQADERRWLDVMVEKRWTAPSWPSEYGGGGLTPAHEKIIREEMSSLRIPLPLVGFGFTMIGPALLQYGNEELKREHLPKICSGEVRWAQGYSEPGAGSDLASLRTAAIRDGDDFVVTGQKVWSSYADDSDWMFVLVRTDPDAPKKQQGITFLLMNLESPGVTVQPTQLISGRSPFCETFFEEVRVPVSNVVGEIDAGWTVAKFVLEYERSTHGAVFSSAGTDEESPLVAAGRRYLGEEDGRIADPVFRDRVAQLEMDRICFEATIARIRARIESGQKPGPESSLLKLYASEFNMRRKHLLTEILGLQAMGWEGEGFAGEELEATRDWLRSRGNSIEGGTSEVQRNIIAKHVLQLPD